MTGQHYYKAMLQGYVLHFKEMAHRYLVSLWTVLNLTSKWAAMNMQIWGNNFFAVHFNVFFKCAEDQPD